MANGQCLAGLVLGLPMGLTLLSPLRRTGRHSGALLALPGWAQRLRFRPECASARRPAVGSVRSAARTALP